MNRFSEIESLLLTALEKSTIKPKEKEVFDLVGVSVEPPKDPSHGDVATNIAMVLTRQAGMAPRSIAQDLQKILIENQDIVSVDIAGPGFINMCFTDSFWQKTLGDILSNPAAYGSSDYGQGQKINIEYVSANPTGPMHVGHCRGAVVGDALARLKAFIGFDVTKEYYINDAGAQVDVLARSAYLRYREALGEDIGEIAEGLYPGDYLIDVGTALAEKYGASLKDKDEREWLEDLRLFAIDAMMALIRSDLKAVGVTHDVFFSERSLLQEGQDKVADALKLLDQKGLMYQGVLPPPKGKLPEDWEDREQTLFKATDYGDDVDRAVQKADGSYTYFASDIAYHFDKIERGFKQMIDVWGADHGGYVKRMKAVVSALSDEKARLDIKLCQLVKLSRDGEPIKMSKRSGDFVTLRDVVDEVGVDAVRFMMLYRKNDAPLDFDFVKVREQSRDNPVFYVQYAHARCASILRAAAKELRALDLDLNILKQADFSVLSDEGELLLIKRLAQWPRLVEMAGRHEEPHRIAFYLYDLAGLLHGQWNKGKDNPSLRFINHEELTISHARLSLVKSVQLILSIGLNLLGVSSPDELR